MTIKRVAAILIVVVTFVLILPIALAGTICSKLAGASKYVLVKANVMAEALERWAKREGGA